MRTCKLYNLDINANIDTKDASHEEHGHQAVEETKNTESAKHTAS